MKKYASVESLFLPNIQLGQTTKTPLNFKQKLSANFMSGPLQIERKISPSTLNIQNLRKDANSQLSSRSNKSKIDVKNATMNSFKKNFFWNTDPINLEELTERENDEAGDEIGSFSNIEQTEKRRIATPGHIGDVAVKSYYDKYRRLNREKEESKDGYSAVTSYLIGCEKKHMIPIPMGIIARKGSENTINLNSYAMGDNYAEVLGSSLPFLKTTKMNISGNALSHKGASFVLRNLTTNIMHLDLSKNKIGMNGAVCLQEHFAKKDCKVELLNLEDNALGDRAIQVICDSLKSNKCLKELNLSKNKITDYGAKQIGLMLEKIYSLQKLELHWNEIKGPGAISIFTALIENTSLKVLDISWNAIGSFRDGRIGSLIAEAANQENLVHLDISNNSMCELDCTNFANKLEKNHHLYGLHMLGNDAAVDSLGFVKPIKKPRASIANHQIQLRMQGKEVILRDKLLETRKTRPIENCWICEGWTEVKFVWNSKLSGREAVEPVYLHLDFDNWVPDLMYPDETDPKIFFVWRMIPPGMKIQYFYTIDGEVHYARNQPVQRNDKPQTVNVEFDPEDIRDYKIGTFNSLLTSFDQNILDDSYNVKIIHCEPRPPRGVYVRPFQARVRTPWTLPISIWRDFRSDNEKILNDCFEFDWGRMKKPKLKGDEEEKVKGILKANYKFIRETYKYYSAIGKVGELNSIPFNMYNDIVVNIIGLVDNVKIRFSDSDTLFLMINGNKRGSTSLVNPATALVRHEFMEVLTRLAIKRYFDPGTVQSESEAVSMMLQSNLIANCSHFDCQKWRDERFWNEECDYIFKAFAKLFEYLYNKYGGTHRRPGDKMFMMADEFESFISDAGLMNENFASRDINAVFGLSMLTQVNEMDSMRHLRATYIEFVEAMGRAADKLSIPPPSLPDAPPMSMEERNLQPLVKKIENMIPILMANCTKKEFKEKYIFPSKDPETGLYEVPSSSPYFKRSPTMKRSSLGGGSSSNLLTVMNGRAKNVITGVCRK